MPWFIEKKGKFFGPFKPEKVLAYAEAGKIDDDTPVAGNNQGKGAVPFAQAREMLERGEKSPVSPVRPKPSPAVEVEPPPIVDEPVADPEPTPMADEVAPPADVQDVAPITDVQDDEPGGVSKEWYIVTPDRRFGPHTLGHLDELLEAGKLSLDDRLQREGQSHLMEVRELFPDWKPSEQRKPPEKAAAGKPTKPRKKAAKPPKKSGKRAGGSRMMSAVIGVCLLLGIAAAVFWLKPFDSSRRPDGPLPGGKIMSKIKRSYEKTSSLRQQVSKANIPPFNELAMQALGEGLNFSYRNIKDMHATDMELFDEKGQRHFGKLFPERLSRELSYAVDGGYRFTYLMGSDNVAFAVIIEHESFSRYKLEDASPGDFAPSTRRTRAWGKTAWVSEQPEGVAEIKAVWAPDETGVESLEFLCVTEAPVKTADAGTR